MKFTAIVSLLSVAGAIDCTKKGDDVSWDDSKLTMKCNAYNCAAVVKLIDEAGSKDDYNKEDYQKKVTDATKECVKTIYGKSEDDCIKDTEFLAKKTCDGKFIFSLFL
jgi:hypothetical protein